MKKKNVLDNMINIPVTQPTRLNQCGTWNVVYPPDTEKNLQRQEQRIVGVQDDFKQLHDSGR